VDLVAVCCVEFFELHALANDFAGTAPFRTVTLWRLERSADSTGWRSRMLYPVPRSDRGDLFAIVGLVGLLLSSIAATFFLSM
jgi:hypothetical protein